MKEDYTVYATQKLSLHLFETLFGEEDDEAWRCLGGNRNRNKLGDLGLIFIQVIVLLDHMPII